MADESDVDQEQALELSEHIFRLGEERRHDELAELAHDPSTRRLLGLLPESARERAEAHLNGAERWEQSRRETNTRRLAEARRAVDGLDLELARGLIRKIDGRYLTEDELEERDDLLLEISARAMEVESIAQTGQQLIEETEHKRSSRDRSWWRRRLG